MLVLEYIKNILDKPLTKEERVQLDSLCWKTPNTMCDTAFQLAWDELKKRLNSQELASYPMRGICELGNISYDILLSSICKLMRESKNGWKEKVIDNLSDKDFDILYGRIERYRKIDIADANVEALKKVKLQSVSFLVPQYAGEYCFQALSNAPHFPWGKRLNASTNEIYSYDNFNEMWKCLHKIRTSDTLDILNIPDWYEYEKNTGFNFSLYLLLLCEFYNKTFKCSDSYAVLKKELAEITNQSALKIMQLTYYRCFIMNDILASHKGTGSYLSNLPLKERLHYLENNPLVKYYDVYEDAFLKWVIQYEARADDKIVDVTNNTTELLSQEFFKRANQPIKYLFDFLPLKHYSNTGNGTTKRSNINKYFVNIHELVYKIVSRI